MFRRQQELECHVLSHTLLQQLIRLVVSLLCSYPEKEMEKYFVTYIANCLQLIINMSSSRSSQDFKDAIAIYPDLSNVRYDGYLIVIAYSGPLCTFLLVDIESCIWFSSTICRLKDLELLLENVVAAGWDYQQFAWLKYSERVEFIQSTSSMPEIITQNAGINHCTVFLFKSSLWSISNLKQSIAGKKFITSTNSRVFSKIIHSHQL